MKTKMLSPHSTFLLGAFLTLPGLHINLLIVFGPVLALVLNRLSVLHVHFETNRDRIDGRFSIYK